MEKQKIKTLIEMLKAAIENSIDTNEDPNETSWGYEKGILISRREAQLIVKHLTQTP